MERKKVFVKKIEPSLDGSFFNLFLQEDDGVRAINITIGEFEAYRMAIEIDGIKTQRPLTYDLFAKILKKFNIQVTEVEITKFKEGCFYAKIICKQKDSVLEFDSRSSDAINMALKFKSPIFASEEVLDKVGFPYYEIENKGEEPVNKNLIIQKTKEELIMGLELLLDVAVKKEDYDLAAKLRDQLNVLKNEK
ncbi:MAG: bifunctional nuclease family protein [Bacteroidales bacterium]|nr:bifunctional nuclease family protein [Bacteroidales bacterium]